MADIERTSSKKRNKDIEDMKTLIYIRDMEKIITPLNLFIFNHINKEHNDL